jgi:hypothetical protein
VKIQKHLLQRKMTHIFLQTLVSFQNYQVFMQFQTYSIQLADKDILRTQLNQNVHYSLHNSTSLDPTFISSIHSVPSYTVFRFLEIYLFVRISYAAVISSLKAFLLECYLPFHFLCTACLILHPLPLLIITYGEACTLIMKLLLILQLQCQLYI